MRAQSSGHLENVDQLLQQSETLRRYASTIYRLDRLLTPPSVPMLLDALRRLRRLQQVLSWQLPVIGELAEVELDQLIRAMAVPPMQVDQMDVSGLQDAYPIWATLASHDPQPDSSTCLYGLLVLVAGCQPKKSVIQHMASAIRGASRKQPGVEESLETILGDLPYVSEPQHYYELLVDHRHRIQLAKPVLHELLISDIPALLGWPLPEYRPDPEELDWTPPRPVQLPPATPVEPWEPEEEVQSPDEYLPATVDISRPITSLRAALLSIQQRIHGGNPLLISEHISSLRKEEARYLADWLYSYVLKSTGDADSRMLSGATILATMLVAGRTAPRAAEILETALSPQLVDDRPTLDLDKAQLVQPVLIPDSAYSPDDDSRPHLLGTSRTMRLPLPQRYVEIVDAWRKKAPGIRPYAHWRSIYPVLELIRGETGLDYTEGRIRHTLSCHACDVSGDPVQSIWITSNDARHSLAPAHYCVLDHCELANTYAQAIWPILQNSEAAPHQSAQGLVGAQTCPTDEFIRRGLKRLTARVHSPTRGGDAPKSLAEIHNGVVDHITILLVVLTGHRPTTAIHRLNRWSFDLELGVAVYRDKKSDPAHFFCPVALGAILTEQLVVYEHHLAALRDTLEKKGASQVTVERVSHALSGEAPWFFHLEGSLQAKEPSFQEWRDLFSDCFPGVPPNVGRSYLARKLRMEEGSRPEFAYLQLGHYAIIGYPYLADGPTSIAEMARSLGPVMDKVVESSLGRMRKVKGLYRGSRSPKPLQLNAPRIGIRGWAPERREAEQAALGHKQRLREQRRKRANELRPEAEARFFRRMKRINSELSDALEGHLQHKRLPDAGRKYLLKAEDIELLLSESPGDSVDTTEALPAAEVIALRNFTHYALSKARTSRYYRGPLPRAEIRLPSRFHTEFHPNMLAAAETMRRLRSEFYAFADRDVSKKAAADGVTDEEWRCAYLAAVLILFGGVTHLSRLIGMLSPGCQVARHPGSDDAVLVQYSTEPPHVWALWRTAAITYLQLRDGIPEAAPDTDRISRALRHVLPKGLQRDEEGDLLSCLLDTARTAELTYLSGMARASIHPETGSWSLPLQRQIAWLSNTDDQSIPPEGIAKAFAHSRSGRMPKAREVKDVYDKILDLMPRANKDVLDADGNVTIPHETHRRYRRQVIDSIRDVVNVPQVPELALAAGDWLCQMYQQQKSEGDYVLAESTIYNYFTTVVSGLLSVLPERVAMDLDDDEYIDLYAALLERKPEKSRKTTARELRNFHSLLTKKHGAPELDWSELADYLIDVPGRVDAQVVLSREAGHALRTLESWAFSEATRDQIDRRLMRQCYLVLLLLILTGCRLSEVTGLQYRDIYQLYQRLYIRVRPNYGRGTKSNAAKRILDVAEVISAAEMGFLLRWMQAEKRRLGKKWKMTTHLLLDIETNRPVDRDILRAYSQTALRQSSLWPLISHHLRHGLGGRMQLDFGLCNMSVAKGVRMDGSLQYVLNEDRQLLMPRSAKRYQVLIGHASNSTTNRSYGHSPWVYLHIPAIDWSIELDSDNIAAAIGCSPAAHRKLKSRHGQRMWSRILDRWIKLNPMDAPHEERGPPDFPRMPVSGLPPSAQYMIACAPSVTNPQKGASASDYENYGLTSQAAMALQRVAEDVARVTGTAFFAQHAEIGHNRSSMVPRASPYSGEVLSLLGSIIHEPDRVDLITTAFLASANPSRRQEIVLPKRQAYDLSRLVSEYCRPVEMKVAEHARGYHCELFDPDQNELNHWLSWTLSLMAVIVSAAVSGVHEQESQIRQG